MKCKHWETEPTKDDLYYYYPDGTEAGYLCWHCATDEGFCPSCGGFIAGVEAEDHYIQTYGTCSNCVDYDDDDSVYDFYENDWSDEWEA